MRHKPFTPLKRAIFLMAPFVFLSCEKPNQGLGFDQIIGEVPGAERIEYGIQTQTHNLDSILVAINYDGQVLLTGGYGATKLIGTYVDPLFGQAKAELVSELIMEDLNPVFGETAIVDSVNLYLRTTGYYGDTTMPMQWQVHMLADSLSRDSTYFSNYQPNLGSKIGELLNFTPRPNSALSFEGERISPTMKIPLNTAYFQSNFADQGDGFESFTTNEKFRKYFPGIKVSVNNGPGSIISISPTNVNSKILIFYRLSDTSSTTETVELNFSQIKSTRPIGFSTFSQDYSTYPISFDLNNVDSEEAYVQSMGGVYTTIRFQDLDTLKAKGYVINQAFVEMPIERGTTGGFGAHPSLEIRRVEEGVPASLTRDFTAGNGGGALLSGELRDNKYRFLFTQELFDVLTSVENGEEMPTFALVPVSKSTVANRTVLKGGKSGLETPKLVVYFTKP